MIDTEDVHEAANELKQQLTTPDVALLHQEAKRRGRLRRQVAVVGVVLLAVVGGLGITQLGDSSNSTRLDTASGGTVTSSTVSGTAATDEPWNLVVFLKSESTDAEIEEVLEVIRNTDSIEQYQVRGREEVYAEFVEAFKDEPELLATISLESMPIAIDLATTDDFPSSALEAIENLGPVRTVVASTDSILSPPEFSLENSVESTTTTEPSPPTSGVPAGSMNDVMLLASPSDVFFAEQFADVAIVFARRCNWLVPGETGAEFAEGVSISVDDVSLLLEAIGCDGGLIIRTNGDVTVFEPTQAALERIDLLRAQLPFEITIDGESSTSSTEQLLQVSPNPAKPNDLVTVAWDTNETFGAAVIFERWDGAHWVPTHALIAEGYPDGPYDIPVDEYDGRLRSLGFISPMTIQVPSDAVTGDYRLCIDRQEALCGLLDVVAPEAPATTTTTSPATEPGVYPPDLECDGLQIGTVSPTFSASSETFDTIEEAVQSFLGDGGTPVEGWSEAGGVVAIRDSFGKVTTHVIVEPRGNGWLPGTITGCAAGSRNAEGEVQSGLTLTAAVASAGDEVVIDGNGDLGGWFTFDIWAGEGWEPVVGALQIKEVNGTARTIPLGENIDIDDIEFEGPITIVIPDNTVAGSYRVCVFGIGSLCGNLRIE